MILFKHTFKEYEHIMRYVTDELSRQKEAGVSPVFLFETFDILPYKELSCFVIDTKEYFGFSPLRINFTTDIDNRILFIRSPGFFSYSIQMNYEKHTAGISNGWALNKYWRDWLETKSDDVNCNVLISNTGEVYNANQYLLFAQLFFSLNYFVYNMPAQVTHEVISHIKKSGKPGKKKKYKQTFDVLIHVSIPTGEHKDVIYTCPCWEVRGHQRHMKDGRIIYVRGYKKGKLRDKISPCDRDIKIKVGD